MITYTHPIDSKKLWLLDDGEQWYACSVKLLIWTCTTLWLHTVDTGLLLSGLCTHINNGTNTQSSNCYMILIGGGGCTCKMHGRVHLN